MKDLLIDASFSASWFLKDESQEASAKVLEQMQAGRVVFAPNLWLLEITNLLFLAQRRGRIDVRTRNDAFARIPRLSIQILPPATFSDLARVYQLTDKHQLTAYDAEYLRLAMEGDLILATNDRQLARAAQNEKVDIIGPI